jgi:hypothetical protein
MYMGLKETYTGKKKDYEPSKIIPPSFVFMRLFYF